MGKMLKKYFCASILLLAMGNSHAQAEFNFGVKGAGEMYQLWNMDGDFSSPLLGFGGGFFARFTFLGVLGIQPEMLYMQKGGKFSQNFTNQDVYNSDSTELLYSGITIVQTRTTKINSLTFPLLFKLYAPGFIAARPNLFAGPFYAYQIGDRKIESTVLGNQGGQIYSGEAFHGYLDLDKGEDNPHEMGIMLGLGIDFGLGTFDLRYALGLSEIEKSPAAGKELEDYHTGVLFLSFGFLF